MAVPGSADMKLVEGLSCPIVPEVQPVWARKSVEEHWLMLLEEVIIYSPLPVGLVPAPANFVQDLERPLELIDQVVIVSKVQKRISIRIGKEFCKGTFVQECRWLVVEVRATGLIDALPRCDQYSVDSAAREVAVLSVA